ncbi:hypothetical protein GWK08_09325 [Leptobacterium flavescens]|uniref:TraB/GumN family protein n=1 Tax=Leptobacterium flavescens TaxID=472055 RepID=A0A6P0UKZ0_9FLAO|nr:DUF5694 domain-containing protein [Leptobacterium flavescens]NER13637.1 hypothetical protein [Leptobacterium flavescens]
MRTNFKLFSLIFIFVSGFLFAQDTAVDYDKHFADVKKSELLLLGTFHFKDAGLDGYKPKYDVNIMSEEKQKELMVLLEAIKKYGPTKIAVEYRKSRQGRLDSLYNAYLEGKFELRANEIYQVGFRLGKMLGHKKIYAVDTRGKGHFEKMSDEEYKQKEMYFIQKAKPETIQRELMLDKKFTEIYEIEDQLKTKISLVDYFLRENDPKMFKKSHGHYLIGNFKMGEGNDYFGPDAAMSWYNRNIRIFHNLLGIQEPGKDKVFLLIGAGHLPILDFLADSSPDFKKREFKEFVK